MHTLPSQDFVYGKDFGKDREGATEMIRHWKYHTVSPKTLKDIDFKLSNAASVSNGLSTASEFSKFRKDRNIRMKLKTSSSLKSLPATDTTYGEALRPSTPMKAVMSNFYGNYHVQRTHEKYQNTSLTQVSRSHSKSTQSLKRPQELNQAPSTNPVFKLKKFLSIQSRTDCWRTRPFLSNKKT